MNCQEFENLVHALASSRLPNAAQQARGLAHAESCSACLTRLQNERVLATGLSALAAETREKQAPARIEDALLVAFRGSKNRASPEAKLAVPSHSTDGNPTNLFSGTRAGHANRRAWIIGAAASTLLLAGVGFMHWRDWFAQRASSQSPRVNVLQAPPASTPLGQFSEVPRNLTAASAAIPKVKKGSLTGKTHHSSDQGNVKRKPDSTLEEEIGPREIDTRFLPLMAASPLEPTESGHLIRVNLPRSTMGRFGFPISSEKIEEPVKADVLIGEDGVARAIRFVYTAEALPNPGR